MVIDSSILMKFFEIFECTLLINHAGYAILYRDDVIGQVKRKKQQYEFRCTLPIGKVIGEITDPDTLAVYPSMHQIDRICQSRCSFTLKPYEKSLYDESLFTCKVHYHSDTDEANIVECKAFLMKQKRVAYHFMSNDRLLFYFKDHAANDVMKLRVKHPDLGFYGRYTHQIGSSPLRSEVSRVNILNSCDLEKGIPSYLEVQNEMGIVQKIDMPMEFNTNQFCAWIKEFDPSYMTTVSKIRNLLAYQDYTFFDHLMVQREQGLLTRFLMSDEEIAYCLSKRRKTSI